MAEQRGYRVSGRVQGVGFRWWTRRLAESLGVVGTVRNVLNGDVEVMAAGTEVALASLESGLRDGPPLARVERLDTIDFTGRVDSTSFSIED